MMRRRFRDVIGRDSMMTCSPIHAISLAKSSSTVRTGSNKQRRNFLHMVLLKDKAVKALSDYHHERKISRLTIER